MIKHVIIEKEKYIKVHKLKREKKIKNYSGELHNKIISYLIKHYKIL